MAFKRHDNFVFPGVVEPATSVVDGKVSIPLVFTLEGSEYHGFVPGIVMKDIVSSNLEECQNLLVAFIKKTVKSMIDNKQPFPFFPTNEEIKKDYVKTVLIKRFSVKVN